MRTRFSPLVLVAFATLTTGALGVAVTLATTDIAKWPASIRPYHNWGWWVVLALLFAAAALSTWQYAHQLRNPPAGPLAPTLGGEVRWPTPDHPISNLAARNPLFTGREELLDALTRDLSVDRTAAVVQAKAIHGLGGIGKTQLVLEYAYRHADDYDLVWWVTAEKPATVPDQLVALARRLNMPEAAEEAETINILMDELRQHGRWLLIFDNAEHPQDLRAYWPSGDRGHVLVTSRNPAWGGLASTVEVDELSRGEAVTFLRRRLGRDDPALDRLADALGCLPLALEQAAAYLEETATTVNAYLDLLATRAGELFQRGRPATTEQTVATVWSVSVERLRTRTPAAEDLLCLCAYLAADDIPQSLPADHPDVLPERLATTVRDPLGYQRAIAGLLGYSLIKISEEGQRISLHRLVQAVTRQQLGTEQQRLWATAALRILRVAFPDRRGDPQAWPTYARLLPHALAVTSHAEALDIERESTIWLLRQAAIYLWRRADYSQARSLHEHILAILESRQDADPLEKARTLSDLANVLYDQRERDSARSLHERALAIYEEHRGPDHLDTAHSLTALAGVLRTDGTSEALARARSLQERALVIFEARPDGHDRPDTARGLNNLGLILRAQFDLKSARAAHERALAIRETSLGRDHPETADSLSNLALVLTDLVLTDQDHSAEALALHKRALATREASLGPNHPLTARSLHNVANLLREQGDPTTARRLLERALGIREVALGPKHPHTARSLHSLANLLREQGDPTTAQTLLKRTVSIYEERLGPHDPDTVKSRRDLAAVAAELAKRL
jgi:tetratricopeptide (TPR) repeat protein